MKIETSERYKAVGQSDPCTFKNVVEILIAEVDAGDNAIGCSFAIAVSSVRIEQGGSDIKSMLVFHETQNKKTVNKTHTHTVSGAWNRKLEEEA